MGVPPGASLCRLPCAVSPSASGESRGGATAFSPLIAAPWSFGTHGSHGSAHAAFPLVVPSGCGSFPGGSGILRREKEMYADHRAAKLDVGRWEHGFCYTSWCIERIVYVQKCAELPELWRIAWSPGEGGWLVAAPGPLCPGVWRDPAHVISVRGGAAGEESKVLAGVSF
jgi:hypothetical protein